MNKVYFTMKKDWTILFYLKCRENQSQSLRIMKIEMIDSTLASYLVPRTCNLYRTRIRAPKAPKRLLTTCTLFTPENTAGKKANIMPVSFAVHAAEVAFPREKATATAAFLEQKPVQQHHFCEIKPKNWNWLLCSINIFLFFPLERTRAHFFAPFWTQPCWFILNLQANILHTSRTNGNYYNMRLKQWVLLVLSIFDFSGLEVAF